MKFLDDRVIKYAGRSFERPRVVQGILIYTFFIGFSILTLIHGDKLGYLILSIVLLGYVGCFLFYMRKLKNKKQVTLLALLRLITIPTWTTG